MARGVDRTDHRATYVQIADDIRDAIRRADYEAGDKIPSESQLVKHYGVNGGTVRQAIRVLREEGLVVSEHGRGAFVRRRPRIRRLAHDRFARRHREQDGKAAYLIEAEQADLKPSVDVLYVGPEKASAEIASHLGIRAGAKVLARRRIYSADEQPTEIATSYLPWKIGQAAGVDDIETGPGGIYARLEEAGFRLGRFTEDVTARMPSNDETEALRLVTGTPVLALVRVAYDERDRPVEVCDTVMSSDHYLLSYQLPAD